MKQKIKGVIILNNDLTFFTNEPERSLYDRFSKILKRNTEFFDVLVGYFRASGFYLMQDALKDVEKTRILIGINTDRKILDLYKEAQGQIDEINLSNIDAINEYKENLTTEFEKSNDTEEVEEGVNQFIELIKNGKLELRLYTKQPIHAKVYIMRDFEDSPDFGRVITGSSNFSKSGLVNNLEFNVELKNSADINFALEKFEELWKESVEINEECISTIEHKTWIKSDITPYEMYVKFLYEYFKEEIDDDSIEFFIDKKITPYGFKPLQYQKDAVIQAKRIIQKHNGVFISDVVGLGKTYICAMLARELNGRSLIICPPVLVNYWENVMEDFGVRGYKIESVGKLDKIDEEESEKFSYIFVDESHRFRNSETEQYKKLHEICVKKKVILISATPQNNYYSDIANQLYLFEPKNRSTFVGVRNLEAFFKNIAINVAKCEKGSKEQKDAIKQASKEIRDKVLREVMIRRTRTEIQKNYGEDLKKQGLEFPKVSNPKKLVYAFDNETEEVFEKTIEKIRKLNYSRYKPLMYIKEERLKSVQKSLLSGQANMSGFMKGVLVKRLESSKYAFEKTLERFIASYREFMDMYIKRGTVWISKKINVQELLVNDEIDELEELFKNEKTLKFDKEDFKESFIIDLQKDLQILCEMKDLWHNLKKDNKIEYFIQELQNRKILKENKILIFTESRETAEYIAKTISKRIKENILMFSGSMPANTRDTIRENFDPTYAEEKQKNEYRILVTTDVLAEGMNLHRSNVIVNYDLPWNPTKIMQRVGRINRVGTKHSEIYVYNFFPTSKSNEQMSLEENIIPKMQMFHDILGEDTKFLTDDEDISTYELFRKMTTSITEESDEISSELTYLKIIRDIRDNDKELFEKIKRYPRKIKVGRSTKSQKSVLTFFRKGDLKRFFISTEDGTEELTFEQAVELVRTNKKEKGLKVTKKYFELLKMNKKAFKEAEKEEKKLEAIGIIKRGNDNSKKVVNILKQCLKMDTMFDDLEMSKINSIIDLIQKGELPTKTINEANKKIKKLNGMDDLKTFYEELANSINKVYFEKEENNIDEKNSVQKEFILSEYYE